MNKNIYSFSEDEFGVHKKILKKISSNQIILEIGCANGYLTKHFKKLNNRVVAVEINPKARKYAEKYCSKLIIGDIEDKDTLNKLKLYKFDLIVLADILEHLKNPGVLLEKLKPFLKKDGKIIISIPNIGFFTSRLQLLKGRFEYQDFGIMDRTHLRFFTKSSISKLIAKAGFKILDIDYIGNFSQLPLFLGLYKILGKFFWFKSLEYNITKLWPEGLAVQFLIVCKKNEKT